MARRPPTSLLAVLAAVAAAAAPGTGAAGAPPAAAAPQARAPWMESFEKDAVTTDKGDYVHFFWDAAAHRQRFEGPGRAAALARAAVDLVATRFPKASGADRVRVDIVFVLEKDNYGKPKWDSLRKVAHFEGSRRRVAAWAEANPWPATPVALFEKQEISP